MPDLPADITTPALINVGGTYSDRLEVVGDRDWVRVNLTAGQAYTITLNATGADPLNDPFLYLYDAAGGLLRSDDDGGVSGLNSQITHVAPTTGTYYIGAGAFSDNSDGDYTISVTEVLPPSLLDTINWGQPVADTNVSVYFALTGETFDGITCEGWNAYEISRFQAAFDLIAAVSGLNFTIVNAAAGADFRLVLDTNQNGGSYLGYFNPPGTTNEGVGVFAGQSWDRAAGGDLDAGGYGMVTIVHEVLHGLGFAHPHDNGGTSTIMPGVTAPFDDYGDFDLNQGIFTTMSYNTGYFTGTPGSGRDAGGLFGHEYGPMALDIALLQQFYGANAATNAGNTVYVLDSVNAIGTFWQAIWDASGTDEIRHDGSAASVIDLRQAGLLGAPGGGGFVSAVNGIAGGFTIAAGAAIENATGGTGGDVITGNVLANRLSGSSGNDTLEGGDGNDTLLGGAGLDVLQGGGFTDTADYSGSAAGVTVRLWNGTGVGGDAQGDVLSGIENVTGSAHADLLVGADVTANLILGGDGNDYLSGFTGNDALFGEAGNDILLGGAGADTLHGGGFTDMADYSASSAGVTVRLWNGTGLGGDAQGDVVLGIENVTGSAQADVLVGSDGVANQIFGGVGNDYLVGFSGNDALYGEAGNDTLLGGAGADVVHGGGFTDTADYGASGTGVTVRLWNNSGAGGDAQGDVLLGIENLTGSGFDDLLVGNDGVANQISGGAGNDYLVGFSGADRLDGGLGNDTLDGGADGDQFVFAAGYGQDRVTLFQDGLDKVDLVGLTFASLTETTIAGGVRLAITATPATFIDLIGVTLAQVEGTDFV